MGQKQVKFLKKQLASGGSMLKYKAKPKHRELTKPSPILKKNKDTDMMEEDKEVQEDPESPEIKVNELDDSTNEISSTMDYRGYLEKTGVITSLV